MSFAVAVGASALLAIFGYPPRAYQYWFSWDRLRTIFWVVFYLALAGVGGGGIGWLTATFAKAGTTGYKVVDGVLYAIAGTLAIRADLAPRPRTTKNSEVKAAASLLVGAINWIKLFLDSSTESAITKWLRELPDRCLLDESEMVYSAIQQDRAVPKTTKDLQKALYEPIFESLDTADLSDRIRRKYRAHLIGFCREFYCNQKTIKTTLGKGPASAKLNSASNPPKPAT